MEKEKRRSIIIGIISIVLGILFMWISYDKNCSSMFYCSSPEMTILLSIFTPINLILLISCISRLRKYRNIFLILGILSILNPIIYYIYNYEAYLLLLVIIIMFIVGYILGSKNKKELFIGLDILLVIVGLVTLIFFDSELVDSSIIGVLILIESYIIGYKDKKEKPEK